MISGALKVMHSRILCAAGNNGVYIREDNGRLVEVSGLWAAPLIAQMSKSACRYALLGIAGRKDHSVVLSRRQITALQSFVEQHSAKQ